MANWNLSVDLRGHGNDLAQALKSSAKHARRLATAARDAKNDVKELGQASQTASRHVRSLGSEARTTARRLNTLGDGAQNAARRLGRYGDAAQRANRHVNSLGDNSRTTGRQLARMSGQIDTAVRDLLRLAQAAQRADARLNRVGGSTRGMRRYAEETGRARRELMSVANLLTGGAFAIGGAELLKMGGEYQQAMNTFGAVTGATAMQMQRAAATADQLGNDLSLPAASATDAAEAMVELAKAGFRTDQAISATRASLQLAAAAQINAADSAKYLGDMMDQFGMGADQASVAADTLAATANAASGDIIDIYYAMKYAGPVAHGLGVTMQEAASAVGMLGKAGILGQTAGTTLRGMMANLAAPTPQMIEGLKAMGIEAWDAQGNFKGLRHVIDGLSKAQHHMTQQDFAAAVKKSMGKPAMSGAIALAHQGVDSFDALMSAVSDTGAASDIAAAKGKGLAGAMLQLKTQAKQTGLTIYDGLAPGLEFLTRGTTSLLARATPKIKEFFDYFNDAATLFGPDLAAAAREELAGIADAAADLAGPFKDLGTDALAALLHILITGGTLAAEVLSALAEGAEPVVDALSGLTGEGNTAATTLDLVVTVLDLAATAAGALAGALGPLGHLVGGLVSMFAALPGPIQQFVLAALLVRRLQPGMAGLASTVSGRVTGAFRSLNQQMAVQRSLAAASGMTISRYGAAFAVLQTRVPVIGRMGAAFRTAQSHATGFAGTLRGIGAASASAARSMGSGLMGALGGPWGLAITAATVGLGVLASRQQQAAAAAAEHQNQIQSLSQALRESNGVVDESVRAIATENLMNTKVKTTLDGQQRLVDLARKAKVPMSDLVDAYTNQGTSLSRLQRELKATAAAQTTIAMDPETGQSGKALTVQGRAATDLRKSLGGLSGDFKKAAADARDYNNGVKGAGDGVSAYSRLKDAVGALADKTADADSRTRALRDALDLLSGGSVSLQAAQARVNEAVTNATEAMQGGIDKTDGWGKALLKTNGQLDTTSKNGQALFNTLNTISDGSASASIAAFDFAQSQGKSLPDSLKAARSEMEKNREAAIGLAKDYGLNAEQAARVADSMGLIPGQVSILLQTQGVDQTLAELLAVQAEFEQTPDSKTIKVDALGDEAKKELEDLGYKIKLIPGTREYKITAPTDAARNQLDLLIASMSEVPGGKNIKVDAATQAAITDLQTVQDKVGATKGKTITMSAPTAAARAQLEALGFKIRDTKGKNVVITVPTGSQQANVSALASTIAGLRDRSITITTSYVIKGSRNVPDGSYLGSTAGRSANGNIYAGARVQRFASGGMRENHVAQIAKPQPDLRVWAEPETQGEGYVPFARSKRPRSRAITEEIVRRLGGDPSGIQWNADGSVTDWRYDPQTGSLYSSSDAGAAGHKTKKVKIKGKVKEIEYFDVGAVEKKLKSAGKATQAWNKDLEKVADRVGGDVAEALAAMGKDGMKLADKMAKGSTKYINQMAKALRDLQKTAKASLTDYTRQLDKANKLDKTFSDNLAKLAAQGYGDLAAQLAEQNDEAAMDLAAAAVKDKGKAGKANKAAKTANNALTADQVSQLVSIIAGIKNSKTGIHDVAATTGLGEDDIIAVATKATKQIKSALGSRAGRFLADLAKAQKGMAYENGGIRAGMYATQAGIIRFAEPSTHGEAYVPFAPSKRGAATSVLADVAGRFGLGLTPASGAGGQVVIIREKAPLVGSQTWHVTSGGSADDTARKVDANNSYQLRRLARGGVGARG
ncbi:phage tail tape measure protein [Streptomyces scabiei]|uniref:phage tail tape measure protein n=1 Tax=Streptomyces scabiei TaxID=1930 RepID=UPI0029AD271B|nr:phage tail tape measure protein [Streptomyces scabiei]MDX3175194.1 phage tail tape measure protein [Streptomyces scabiei]